METDHVETSIDGELRIGLDATLRLMSGEALP